MSDPREPRDCFVLLLLPLSERLFRDDPPIVVTRRELQRLLRKA